VGHYIYNIPSRSTSRNAFKGSIMQNIPEKSLVHALQAIHGGHLPMIVKKIIHARWR
jgi:hypothetical protein